jgi:hypothetical protein
LMDAPNFSTKELNVKKLHNNGGCEVKLILWDISLTNVFNISTAYFHVHTFELV